MRLLWLFADCDGASIREGAVAGYGTMRRLAIRQDSQ